MVNDSINYFKTQIKEHTFLGEDGLFKTVPEYPEFCWKEIIVNAIGHRDYGIKGTDIQIKMFDDHVTVESPGIFAGTVNDTNLRNNHFSRNPKIMEFLKVYDFVQEFGEGVDRMYNEMASSGLPEPIYKEKDSMIYATLRNKDYNDKVNDKVNGKVKLSDNAAKIIELILKDPKITRIKIAEAISKSETTVNRAIRELKDNNLLYL